MVKSHFLFSEKHSIFKMIHDIIRTENERNKCDMEKIELKKNLDALKVEVLDLWRSL